MFNYDGETKQIQEITQIFPFGRILPPLSTSFPQWQKLSLGPIQNEHWAMWGSHHPEAKTSGFF